LKTEKEKMKIKKSMLVATAIAGSLWGQNASAQYASGDLLLGFRSSTTTATDLVFDLGSAANYNPYTGSATLGGPAVTLPDVSATLLNSTFGNMNNLFFSVFGYVDAGNPQGLPQPTDTVFLSKPETGGVQTTPSASQSMGAQSITIGYLQSMAAGAAASTAISPTIAQEASSRANAGSISYSIGIQNTPPTGISNIHGTWSRYQVEGSTGASFTSGSSPVTLDLYEQDPGAANGIFLGDFSLSQSGTLTFQPVPEPTSMALLGGGLMALIAVRRFNRK
jgi:hypothetical protein